MFKFRFWVQLCANIILDKAFFAVKARLGSQMRAIRRKKQRRTGQYLSQMCRSVIFKHTLNTLLVVQINFAGFINLLSQIRYTI